jgi:hypothetical protein
VILARECRKAFSRWKQRLQSSRARDLAKGLEPKSEGVFGRVDPPLSRAVVREPVLVKLERPPKFFSAGAHGSDDEAPEAVCDAR